MKVNKVDVFYVVCAAICVVCAIFSIFVWRHNTLTSAELTEECRQTCEWADEDFRGLNSYGCLCMGTFAGSPSMHRYRMDQEYHP